MLLKKAVRNSSFTMIAHAVTLVLGLIFSGMTIKFLGPSLAGFFIIASSLLSWAQMAGSGSFQGPAILQLAKLYLIKDWKQSRVIVSTISSANILISLPFALATLLAFPILFSWSQLDLSYKNEAFLVVILGGVGFLADQWDNAIRATYDGHQRFDLSTYTSIFIGVFGNISKLVVLIIFHDMASLAIVFLVISLVRLIIDIVLVNRLIGGFSFPIWRFEVLKPMLSFGVWNWLGNANNVIYFNVTGLILARSLGSSVLPYVALPQSIIMQIGMFIISCSSFLFPTLAGQGDKVLQDIIRIEDRMRWFLGVVSIAIFGGLFLAGPWFLEFLVNKAFAEKAILPLFLYCIYGIVWAQEVVYVFSALAIGRPKPSVITGLFSTALTIVSLILLIPHFGYISICIAQLWRIPGTVFFTIWIQKALGIKQKFWKVISPYYSSVIALILWAVIIYLSRYLLPESLIVQVPMFFIGFVLYCFTVYQMERKIFNDPYRLSTIFRALDLVAARVSFLKLNKKLV